VRGLGPGPTTAMVSPSRVKGKGVAGRCGYALWDAGEAGGSMCVGLGLSH
jgi:hypothetical protein